MAKREKGQRPRRKWLRRLIRLLVVLGVLGAAGLYGWHALRQEYTVTYDSYDATRGSISNALSLTGNLALIDSASYAAEGSATVRRVSVAAGDAVKDGDALLRLSNGQTVKAEFDGRVNVLNVAEGDAVYAGDTLVQVADMTHLKASLRVSEYDIADVTVGSRCVLTTTATERTYESEIAAIDYISASNGNVAYYTATVYVDVEDDSGVYPGMQVTVTIPKEEAEDVVILNMNALSFDEKNSAFVYMKDASGALKEVSVEVGVSNGNYVEIRSGVSEGDEVYVESKADESSGLSGLFSGMFGSQRFNRRQRNTGSGSWGGGASSGNWGGASSGNWGGTSSGNWGGTGSGSSRGTGSGSTGAQSGGGQR